MLATLGREVMSALRLRAEGSERRRNERLLESLIASSSEARFVTNSDWTELRQLAGGDFLATTSSNPVWLEKYIPPSDRGLVRDEIARATLTGTAYRLEHRVHRPDGSDGWASSRAVPIRDRQGKVTGWLGAASDITARKQAEAALRRSEARLGESEAFWRGIFERLDEGFMIVEVVRDPAGVAPTWRFIEMNPAWERISGLSRDAARGRRVEEAIPGVERYWVDAYVRVAETGEPTAFRMPVRSLGQVYDVRAFRVAPGKVGVLFQEISAQQRQEARRLALLDLGERLRDLYDVSEMAFAAAQALGRTLDVDRAGYATISADGETLTIERDWTARSFPSGAGVHRLADYGAAISDLRRGEAIVVDDTVLDYRTSGVGDVAFDAVATRSLVNVPVVENGRFVAFFFVNNREPRKWHAEDVSFVREVADQARATIERRRSERALRESEDLMRAIYQAVPVGIVHASASGRITGGNAHAERIFGHPIIHSADVSDYREWVGFHPDGRQVEGVEYPLARVLGGEDNAELEVLYRRGDRREAWIRFVGAPVLDANGRKVGAIVASLDVDRERRAEYALRELNATLERQVTERTEALKLYGDVTQSNPSPICAFDRDLALIAFNRAHEDEFFRISGRRVKVGDVFPDLFPREQRERVRELMARAVAGETYTVTDAFGDPEFAKPHFEISFAPLRNAGGEVIGAFYTAKDVTDRLRAQAELAETQEALRQSQKMEAVGQLTGGVAHDFNNLLTVIRSSVDLLNRPGLAEERKARYLDAMSETVDRAAKLTGQLLAFSRRQSLSPEVFDVGRRLGGVADMVDSLTGARIRIVVEATEESCFVRADVSQFETALVNVAVNARDAMDGEGTFTLRLSRVAALPTIRGHAASGEPFVSVAMVDTGCGIEADRLARIFEPFFTTKGVGKGTGLGLSQVFGFAKQSGGDIDVASEVGVGTTFTLYLPEVSATGSVSTEFRSPQVAGSMGGDGRHVLVVEDNVGVGEFCTQLLRDMGYRTTWAVNAEEALQTLGANGEGFDVVFSDVVMPGMGGIALAGTMKTQFPRLPILLTSGYSHVLAADDNHGFALLKKPYSAEQLCRTLNKFYAMDHASKL